jgi:hypothetical protein
VNIVGGNLFLVFKISLIDISWTENIILGNQNIKKYISAFADCQRRKI